MKYRIFHQSDSISTIAVFKQAFTASEGPDEGEVIAGFVANLIETTPSDQLLGCIAHEALADHDGKLAAAVFFSRFTLPDGRKAFILSPMAVATDQQGKGIGQALIRFGLAELKKRGVSLVLTYGDPAFYGKVGFTQVIEAEIPAPFPLSQPEGWLALSLDGSPLSTAGGATGCVTALNDPALW